MCACVCACVRACVCACVYNWIQRYYYYFMVIIIIIVIIGKSIIMSWKFSPSDHFCLGIKALVVVTTANVTWS